jgi:transposase-like protein
MGSTTTRKQYSPDQKMAILKRHLINHENVSDICDDIGLHPNQFYKWQAELFSNGSAVFDRKKSVPRGNRELKHLEEKNSHMEKLVDKKDKIIAEITEDYVRLKKKISDPFQGNGWNPTSGIL